MKYSSFICEHTEEFVLVPKLLSLLKQQFNYVVPISPWMNREGGSLAKEIHYSEQFKVIGLYPKRPKINLNDKNVLLKINKEFISGAKEASKAKIPMILGCPLVRNIWELGVNTECLWVNLLQPLEEEYLINCDDQRSILNKSKFIDGAQVLRLVQTKSIGMSYDDFITAVRAIRTYNTTDHRSYYMGYSSYRPVYFLMKT